MKFKAKSEDCQLIVKVKILSGEILDERELDKFARAYFRGFLKPGAVKKNQIEYTGPVGISLYERLKRPITKRDFLFIIEQIIVAVQKLHTNEMPIYNLVMNIQNVYINEVTKEVHFLYVPVTTSEKRMNLMEFIESIVYSVKPATNEVGDFVSLFTYFIKALTPFDINKIEAFIAKEDRSVVSIIKKQNAGQSGFMTNKKKLYYEHYDKKSKAQDDEQTALLEEEEDEKTGLLKEDGYDSVGYLEEEDTGILLDIDDDATGLLSDIHFPTLFRVLTKETISVNKPVFRLGKEKSYVDYFIPNNIAISRAHADIITRGSRYYVMDHNSKNHTYINEEKIRVQCEVEIHNGDKLRLGNEEFVFNV